MTRHFEPVERPRRLHVPPRQFLIRFLPVAAVVLAAAYGLVELRTAQQLASISQAERTYLQHITGSLAAEVSTSLDHLFSLAGEQAVVEAVSDPGEASSERLKDVFLGLARRNPSYQQIRWIDQTGMERVRIERDRGRLTTVSPQDLQDKSHRYYFAAGQALQPDELYISRLDLHMEHGRIERPLRPVMRIAAPVRDNRGQRQGLLVINIAVRFMLGFASGAPEPGRETEYLLLNQEGQPLSEPQRSADPDERSPVFARLAPSVWARISSSASGRAELADGLWVWETLSPSEAIRRLEQFLPTGVDRSYRVVADETVLKLVAEIPISELVQLRRKIRMPVTLGALLIIVGYAWSLASYLRGRQAERRAALDVAHALAYASNMQRLKELDARFRLLVQASSFGLVVVNVDGDILMANPAAETMFGFGPGELPGHCVDELLPEGLREKHSRFRAAFFVHPELRKMGEGRELLAVTRDNRKIPVEIGLSPFLDEGKQMVLASIIDLSERRLAAEATAQRQTLEQLTQIMEAIPGAIFAWRRSPDGTYSMPFASQGLRELSGIDPESIRENAEAILALIHRDDLARVVRSIETSARELTLWHARFRIAHPEAGERCIEGWSSPRAQDDGGVIWYGYLADLSGHQGKGTESSQAS